MEIIYNGIQKIEEVINYIEDNLTINQIANLYGVSDKAIATLKSEYARQKAKIKAHISSGASEEKLLILGKQLRFKGMY